MPRPSSPGYQGAERDPCRGWPARPHGFRDRERRDSSVPALAGTPVYLAPETLAGAAPTVESDVYALGVLLFHLATAIYPIEVRHHRARTRASGGPAKSLAAVRTDYPRALAAAIDRALGPIRRRGLATSRSFADRCCHIPGGAGSERGASRLRAAAFGIVAAGGAMLWNAGVFNRRAGPQSVSLSQVPLSIQRRVNIRAPSWQGVLVDLHAARTRCRLALQSDGRKHPPCPDAGLESNTRAACRAVA